MKPPPPQCRFCRHFRQTPEVTFCSLRMAQLYYEHRRAYEWAKVKPRTKPCKHFRL
ncbi:hypothetical protein [Gabonibacter chumensis]|uniref:hypothetical protein n=1 Tax=Gabonibacter chumensis TaxID=2972474 RepID=UPI0025744220|nr:hypothetical protein [Gabonibacter chumensis]MCR9011041.1 hypothetical protein [Gabonibacter chumensis]